MCCSFLNLHFSNQINIFGCTVFFSDQKKRTIIKFIYDNYVKFP